MTFEELKLVLSKIGVETSFLTPRKGKLGQQISISCPLAPWMHDKRSDSRPSLSIGFGDKVEWTVFRCFSCHEQGRLWQLIDSYGVLASRQDIRDFATKVMEHDRPLLSSRFEVLHYEISLLEDHIAVERIKALDPSVLDHFIDPLKVSDAREYLKRRSVPEDIVRAWGIKYDHRQGRILFPVKVPTGELVGAVGRAIRPDVEPKYYNYFTPPIGRTLGGWGHLTDSPFLIVVEGWFDLIRAYRWGSQLQADAVCTWRSEMTAEQAAHISGLDKTVQIWYDQDKAGETGWEKARDMLSPSYQLKRARWEDVNVDVGSMSFRDFQEVFTNLRTKVS